MRRLAERGVSGLHFVQARHQRGQVIGLDAGRAVGAIVVADHVAGRLQTAPIGPRRALTAAEVVGDQRRARPHAGDVLLQAVLIEMLDIEQQGHPLLDGERGRALQHGRGDARDAFARAPTPGAGLLADRVEVGGSLGESWSPVVLG